MSEELIKPDDMTEFQFNWVKMCNALGENEACVELARRLRVMADLVEANHWPQVFGFSEGKDGPIRSIHVTVSFPWGG